MPSGSRAASSTSPRTASTVICRPAAPTRRRSSSRASRGTCGRSPTGSCTRRSAGWPTRSPELGLVKGDRVAIYMPMVPEAAIAMLACARLGVIHTVIFGGFLERGDQGPRERLPGPRDHHGRRRLAPGKDRGAKGQRRPRPCRDAERRESRRPQAHGPGRHDDRGPRPLVARARGGQAADPQGGRLRERAPALHPLHERLHREAEGCAAHERGLPPRGPRSR